MSVALELSDNDDLWGPYREEITQRLNRDRPASYARVDQAWMEPTMAWARARMPADEATVIRKYARDEVIRQEKSANRKANRFLKEYAAGRRPLTWADLGPLPFTVDRATGYRIRFDAATPENLDALATLVEEDAKRRYAAEMAVVAALRTLADDARKLGLTRVALIGDLPMRDDGRLADLDWDDENDE